MANDAKKPDEITTGKKALIYIILALSNVTFSMCISLMAPIFPPEVS